MSFAYREVVVSGTRDGVEGTSQCINEITDVMVNQMGWVLEDDRRAQAGSSNETLTHKVVFKSNLGESNDQPNWYMTITSGTGSAQRNNFLSFKIHSAYDVGTHDTAATGVETPSTISTLTLPTDSDGNFVLWISGDKDGIALVTNSRSVYGHALVGRSQHFVDNSIEPFGLYINTSTDVNPATLSCRSIAGEPPQAFQNVSEGEILSYPFSTTHEPRMGLGSPEAFFTAMPLMHMTDDASPSIRKGAIGLISGAWSCAPTGAGWVKETVITVSGSPDREYVAFPTTTNGLVIRKS